MKSSSNCRGKFLVKPMIFSVINCVGLRPSSSMLCSRYFFCWLLTMFFHMANNITKVLEEQSERYAGWMGWGGGG